MITLSWTAPANNGSTISEYQIERWNSARPNVGYYQG